MEKSVFDVSLSLQKMKSEKTYRETELTVIVSKVCALLNTKGGTFSLMFEDDPVLEEEVDRVLRTIEQRLLDILGSCVFNTKVKISRCNEVTKQRVFVIDSSQLLCTVDYHLYLSTQTQVTPILPHETIVNVKAILDRKVCDQQPKFTTEDFVLNKHAALPESDSNQLKQLKSEKSKCVSLADRMKNKSNKLVRYISAFANKDGGRIQYGIKNDGIVEGEVVGVKDKEEIVKKVTKAINKMIWCGGKLERGKHWNIQFVPVKDENMEEIPSLFVVIILVAPVRGGLFIQQPESYHVVQGRFEKMHFDVWKRRFFGDEQLTASTDIVPSLADRIPWSSEKAHVIYHKVLQQLVKYQNDADYLAFEKCASFAKSYYTDTDVSFLISAEEIVTAYKRGNIMAAQSKLAKYEKELSSSTTKDPAVLMFRAVYAKSAIARAKGNYQESYDIAKEGLQQAEIIPAGILTAWFYNHVAIVEKLLSQQRKEGTESSPLVKSALGHYNTGLQHAQASSVEQKFSITITDLQQRIHTFRAITLLGDFDSGANDRKAPSDIEAAKRDLSVYNKLVLDGHKETNYRKIYHLFSLSDLRAQQAQEEGRSESESLSLLQEAFDYDTEAKQFSMKFDFEELTNYANKRFAVITEIQRKVSSLCPRWENCRQPEQSV